MSKLSEPVAKALDKLSLHCKGDNIMIMRIIVGNYSPDQYSHQLFEEIYLLRQAPFNDILSALVEGLPQAIKTTELPSKAAADKGILTEEELKEIEVFYYRLFPSLDIKFPKVVALIKSHRHLLSANAELSFKNQKYKESMVKIVEKLELAQKEMKVMEGINNELIRSSNQRNRY